MTITVKDTLLTAAELLGLEEGVKIFAEGGESAEGERDTKLLLTAFYTVENELALDYLPLIAEDEVATATGVVAYADLSNPAVRVLCVEDEWGESVKYRLFANHIKTQAGKVKIIYAYSPKEKGLDGASEYQTLASKRLIAYGMAAEYSLAVGEMAQASAWDKKYKDAVRAAYALRPCKKIRSRRWI